MSKRRRKKIQMARMPTQQGATAPQVTVKRRAVFNTGYSENGASSTKGSLAAWNPIRSSPQSDIDANLSVLRARSADLYMGSPVAASAINTSKGNVVGAGLKLSPRPSYKLLGISAEDAEQWSRKTKAEFELWASSKHCDIAKRNNFYDMQDIAYTSYLIDGDSFALFKYRKSEPYMPYGLRLQLIEADRVCNPVGSGMARIVGGSDTVIVRNAANGNKIINGVEVNADGSVVAYWVASRYRYDPTDITGVTEWQRVEAFGSRSGMPNMLQICHDERPSQYRGVPELAPVLETLKQVSRYTSAELTAAIIKSFFTLFFMETEQHENGEFPIAEVLNGGQAVKEELDPNSIHLGAGALNMVPPGYELKSMDPQRSLSTFEPFMRELIKQLGAALGIPYEVLMKSFNSSYTASRAALLQAWAGFKMRREWFSRDFCQPTYEAWLAEAVAQGRIEAPGFYDSPLLRHAWVNAEWYGPVMGVLDPEKEAKSAQLRVMFGLSTREKEAAEMTGTDWNENIERLAIENTRLATGELPVYPTVSGVSVDEPLESTAEKGGDSQ